MSPDLPSAGWYPNPDGSGGLRWWSGVGWTEYTRPGAAPTSESDSEAGSEAAGGSTPSVPAQTPVEAAARGVEPQAPVAQPQAPVAPPSEAQAPVAPASEPQPSVAATPEAQSPTAATPQPNAWQQAAPPGHTAWPSAPTYGAYTPPAVNTLTGSGMRPLNGMFADIGRITRRAWLPILGISVAVWAAITVVLTLVTVAFVDFGAARRGLDQLGQALQDSPDGNIPEEQLDVLLSDLGAAFDSLPAAGWALLGIVLTLLFLYAATVQLGAVSRLGMDAAAGRPVRWSDGWRSGFTAGTRLFGYYLLFIAAITAAFVVVAVVIALMAQLAPGLAVAVGILAFLAGIAAGVWLTGRLIPAIPQAVVGGHALRWSWQATRGKFWAVLGRYLLWSLAASIIINVITSVLSIPVSLVFLGEATSADPFASLGSALALNLLLMPLSMATAAITMIGIVPIWRDLSRHPEHRSIDDDGRPITPV